MTLIYARDLFAPMKARKVALLRPFRPRPGRRWCGARPLWARARPNSLGRRRGSPRNSFFHFSCFARKQINRAAPGRARIRAPSPARGPSGAHQAEAKCLGARLPGATWRPGAREQGARARRHSGRASNPALGRVKFGPGFGRAPRLRDVCKGAGARLSAGRVAPGARAPSLNEIGQETRLLIPSSGSARLLFAPATKLKLAREARRSG